MQSTGGSLIPVMSGGGWVQLQILRKWGGGGAPIESYWEIVNSLRDDKIPLYWKRRHANKLLSNLPSVDFNQFGT